MKAYDIPIIVNCRDILGTTRALVSWLELAGHRNIVLLDNASTFPPMLEWLERSPHRVIYLGENLGPYALWTDFPELEKLRRSFFVLTDPDVLPLPTCPHDLIELLAHGLAHNAGAPKAGPGLYLEDLPGTFDPDTLAWERSLQDHAHPIGEMFWNSMIDTTFALYRPHAERGLPALRCRSPYMFRHLPWYPHPLEADELHYREHANLEWATWAREEGRRARERLLLEP